MAGVGLAAARAPTWAASVAGVQSAAATPNSTGTNMLVIECRRTRVASAAGCGASSRELVPLGMSKCVRHGYGCSPSPVLRRACREGPRSAEPAEGAAGCLNWRPCRAAARPPRWLRAKAEAEVGRRGAAARGSMSATTVRVEEIHYHCTFALVVSLVLSRRWRKPISQSG